MSAISETPEKGDTLQRLLDELMAGGPRMRDAYKAVYEYAAGPLFRYGLSLYSGFNREDVRDALNDTFLSLWEEACRNYGKKRISPGWLYTVMRNNVVNSIRGPATVSPTAPLPDPVTEEEREEKVARTLLYDAVNKLPEDLREVTRLHLAGFRRATIASMLQISERTCTNRMKSAVVMLRRDLERGGLALSVALVALSHFFRSSTASALPLSPPFPEPAPPPPPLSPLPAPAAAFRGLLFSVSLIGAVLTAFFLYFFTGVGDFFSLDDPYAAPPRLEFTTPAPPSQRLFPEPSPSPVLRLPPSSPYYGFGTAEFGQFGLDSAAFLTPAPLPPLADADRISSRFYRTLSLKDGRLFAWVAEPRPSESGREPPSSLLPFAEYSSKEHTPLRPLLVRFPVPIDIADFSAGGEGSVVLSADGIVWWWPSASVQAESGYVTAHLVKGLAQVVAVCAGADHFLALRKDGTVWAWGNNEFGQLGDGTDLFRSVPVRVSGLPRIVAISAGDSFSLALDASGSLWAWGSNRFGELALYAPGRTSSFLPLRIPLRTAVTAIEAGGHHSLALDASGAVWAWGANDRGQLGAGDKLSHSGPVLVRIAGGNAVALAAGLNHSAVLSADGTLWVWGAGKCGQLGTGSQEDSPLPVSVKLPGPASAVHAGALHTLVEIDF